MREVTGSSPVSSTKTKGNCESSCLLFWVPAAEGGLHPALLECSGRRSRPCAKVSPAVKTPVRRTRAAGQKAGGVVLPLHFAEAGGFSFGLICLSFWVSAAGGGFFTAAEEYPPPQVTSPRHAERRAAPFCLRDLPRSGRQRLFQKKYRNFPRFPPPLLVFPPRSGYNRDRPPPAGPPRPARRAFSAPPSPKNRRSGGRAHL